ncbi:MAG: DUF4350 domain-containing protein [Candidatus Altiarchaeota archaeon]
MNKKTTRITVAIALLCLITPSVHAAKKVIFYEISTPSTFTKDGGLSELSKKIREEGYEVASISKGTLSRDSLSTYDILIIAPSGQLRIEEISSILWFVTTKGGGVLIIGTSPSAANQLMIPFGMTLDDGTLIDSTDTIPSMDARNFVIDRFAETETTRIIRKGVSKLGFYTGNGMFISGNAECIASGDSDTYSDTQSFQTGSYPCITAATLFGRGLVFGVADGDMLTNNYIKTYDNMNFAKNIIDWLSITVPPQQGNFTYEECQVMIGQLKLEKLRLDQERETLDKTKNNLEKEKSSLEAQLYAVSAELDEIKTGQIGPFTRNQWAMVAGGGLMLLAALAFSRRKGGGGHAKKKEEDILGELGYEFDEEPKEAAPGTGSEIDTEELDKELGEL